MGGPRNSLALSCWFPEKGFEAQAYEAESKARRAKKATKQTAKLDNFQKARAKAKRDAEAQVVIEMSHHLLGSDAK